MLILSGATLLGEDKITFTELARIPIFADEKNEDMLSYFDSSNSLLYLYSQSTARFMLFHIKVIRRAPVSLPEEEGSPQNSQYSHSLELLYSCDILQEKGPITGIGAILEMRDKAKIRIQLLVTDEEGIKASRLAISVSLFTSSNEGGEGKPGSVSLPEIMGAASSPSPQPPAISPGADDEKRQVGIIVSQELAMQEQKTKEIERKLQELVDENEGIKVPVYPFIPQSPPLLQSTGMIYDLFSPAPGIPPQIPKPISEVENKQIPHSIPNKGVSEILRSETKEIGVSAEIANPKKRKLEISEEIRREIKESVTATMHKEFAETFLPFMETNIKVQVSL